MVKAVLEDLYLQDTSLHGLQLVPTIKYEHIYLHKTLVKDVSGSCCTSMLSIFYLQYVGISTLCLHMYLHMRAHLYLLSSKFYACELSQGVK